MKTLAMSILNHCETLKRRIGNTDHVSQHIDSMEVQIPREHKPEMKVSAVTVAACEILKCPTEEAITCVPTHYLSLTSQALWKRKASNLAFNTLSQPLEVPLVPIISIV
jgi:hypothetical protein